MENESGATLARPELFRLIADAEPDDLLLVKQVERLSRLTAEDWEALQHMLSDKRIRVVARHFPTSWLVFGAPARRRERRPHAGPVRP